MNRGEHPAPWFDDNEVALAAKRPGTDGIDRSDMQGCEQVVGKPVSGTEYRPKTHFRALAGKQRMAEAEAQPRQRVD